MTMVEQETIEEVRMRIGTDGGCGAVAVWSADGEGGDNEADVLSGLFFYNINTK